MLIVVATFEEIVYRRILFNAIQEENRLLAILLSCTFFGAIHGVVGYIVGY